MTIPLPSYGIWTTDIDGKRVMGFTPEQFLPVWDDCAGLEAEVKRLREVLRNLYNAVDSGVDLTPDVMLAAHAELKEAP